MSTQIEWTKPLKWNNEGVAPSESLIQEGFKPKYKPAADTFNYFLHNEQLVIEELQHYVDYAFEGLAEEGRVRALADDNEKTAREAADTSEANARKSADDALQAAINAEAAARKAADDSLRTTINENKGAQDAHSNNKNNPHGITPAQIGASATGHKHTLDDVSETAEKKVSRIVAATSTDGVAYAATVSGVTQLYDGMEITIIPNKMSTSKSVTLNVNGLGAKQLRCSIGGYNYGNSGTIAAFEGWLSEGSPIKIQYKAKFDNWQTVIPRPSVSGLYGTVGVEQGGTGATDAASARTNLGAADASLVNIRSYTELAQFGLSDSEMSDTDFMSNIDKIITALDGNAATLMLIVQSDINTKLHASLVKKLSADTTIIFNASTHAGWLSIHFSGEAYRPVLIETNLETANNYDRVWSCVYNKGSSGNSISVFDDGKTPKELKPFTVNLGMLFGGYFDEKESLYEASYTTSEIEENLPEGMYIMEFINNSGVYENCTIRFKRGVTKCCFGSGSYNGYLHYGNGKLTLSCSFEKYTTAMMYKIF